MVWDAGICGGSYGLFGQLLNGARFLAQVIIYNWPGLPNKQTMLTDLVLMIKAAEKVLTGDSNDDHDDEDGETDGEGNPTFGHLIILLRDVEGKAEEIEHLVLRKEATRRLKHDEKLDAGERNTIRDGLRNAFESITVHTMPLPHPNIAGAVLVGHDTPRNISPPW